MFIETDHLTGSGVLIDGGYVLTNRHVVWAYNDVRIVLPDGTALEGVPVVGSDPLADLALLGPIDTSAAPLALSDGEDLPIGSDVYLVGYPAEVELLPQPTITRGILSRLREWKRAGITYFQTDAAITGGQSGGVLVDARANVIGISGLLFGAAQFGLVASAADLEPIVERLVRGEADAALGDRRLPPPGGLTNFGLTIPTFWDVRSFVIYEPPGAAIEIQMESSADGTFWVVDSLGNLLANVDAELSGTESAKFTLEQPGPHFVQFSIASGDYGEFTIASNVPLTPIEDPDDGGRIAVGQTVIGNLDSPEDVDFFIVSLEEGETVYVEADSLNANMYLTIGFPGWTSNQLVFDDDSAGGLRGVNAGVVYRAIKSAPHFIVLGDAVGSNTGGYFLSVREALPGEAPVAIPPSPEFVDTAFGRMLVYESPAGFSVQVPADWLEIEVDPSAGQVFGATSALEESVVIIEEDVTAFLSLSTLDEYADFLETYLFEADPGIDVTSRTTVQTSGGVTVERFELSVAGGVVQAYRYVYISDTGIGFNLVYIFPGERFDAGKGLAEYSVGTLTPAPGTASSDASDRAALVALYNATDGLNWLNNTSWLTDTPIGKWHGVTTDDGGRVTELDLRDNRLSGKIPSELGNLINLTWLSLSQNQLSGEIPTELGSLTSLTTLSLYKNQLSGEIPSELGNLTNLTTLELSENRLSGEIPTELGNLINLTWLNLSRNELSGEIPSELGNLTNLTGLGLSQNQMSGCIPTGLRDVAENDLSGLGLPFCGT